MASKNESTIVVRSSNRKIQLVTARKDQNLEQNILAVVENLVAPEKKRVKLDIQEDSISSFFAYDLFTEAGGDGASSLDQSFSQEQSQVLAVQDKLCRANAVQFFWLAVSTKKEELLRLSYEQVATNTRAIKHICLLQNNIDSRIFADRPQLETEVNALFDQGSVEGGFLYDHKQKVKVGNLMDQFKLEELLDVVQEEQRAKLIYFTPRKHYSLYNVLRKRKQNAALGDYPHLFKLVSQETGTVELSAIQRHQSGDFLIFEGEVKRSFIKYARPYLALLKAGFWGMSFELFDNGVEPKVAKSVGESGFLPVRQKIMKISYERNILGECPRALQADLLHRGTEDPRVNLRNIAPVFNYQRGCYTLNFHGRAVKASARNFQMREMGDDQGDVLLMHGKVSKNNFHLDFRHPLSIVEAFAISLASISKKRLVS